MPELPEVETVKNGISKNLLGKKITKVVLGRSDIRFPIPKNFIKLCEGCALQTIERRGKYILIHLSKGQSILLHLGMSGRVLIQNTKDYIEKKHDHAVFTFDNKMTLSFNDPRRFGILDIIPTDKIDENRFFKKMGPEPFSNHFHADYLFEKLKKKNAPIKAALLDQNVIAGLGNIYVSEALFDTGVLPTRLASSLTRKEVDKLVPNILATLQRAIDSGGSSLKDYRQSDGSLGYFQHQFKVYDKDGEPCPGCTCNLKKTGGIQRIIQSGRSTFYCSTKQS